MAHPAPLRTGCEVDCPADDTITRQTVANLADRIAALAAATGRRTYRTTRWVGGENAPGVALLNWAVASQPMRSRPRVADRLSECGYEVQTR